MTEISAVADAMIAYYAKDVKRINHFLKVYGFAKMIGELEGLDSGTQQVLEIAALVHDIGIKNSERKYGSSAGSYQQTEGPPAARALLEQLGVPASFTDRVCYLVAHHHTYENIDGVDYQILVEADFLVNCFEENMPPDAIDAVRNKIFRTETGIRLMKNLYP